MSNSTSFGGLREQFIDKLNPMMAKHGFKYVKSRQAYERRTANGRNSFHLAFIPHPDDFDIVADVAVRVDALEDLLNESNENVSNSEKQNTFSIGAEVGNLSEGKQKRWAIRSDSEVADVASQVFHVFETIAVPYLEKYSELEAMLAVLGRNDREGWLHSPMHAWRCMKAVGAAFLLGKHDHKEELIRSCDDFLSTNGKESDRKLFGQFVQRIRDREARARGSG